MNRGRFRRLFSMFGESTYNDDAADYFARVSANGDNTLTPAQKAAINTKFIALAAQGLNNSTVDRLWCDECCYTEIQALTAWLWNGIGTDLATAVNSPTFTAGIGWTFNGSSYLRSGWIPSTGGNKYTLNNASIIWKAFGIANAVNYFIHGIYDGVNQVLVGQRGTAGSSNFFYYRLNSNAASNTYGVAEWTNETIFKAIRNGSNTSGIEYDSNTYTNNACASNGVPTIELYIGAMNNQGTADLIANAGTGIGYYAIGDSTLNKDTIDTALAT